MLTELELTTDQLQPGDIVSVWGMKIRLEGKPITYPGTWGLVYLWSEMPIIEGINPINSSSRWDIQGNDRAAWAVRREVTP